MEKITWSNKNFDSHEILAHEMRTFFYPSVLAGVSQFLLKNDVFLTKYNNGKSIVTRVNDELYMLDNCCLHKNVKLLENSDEIKKSKIVCPVHFWSYDMTGKLLKVPHSDFKCENMNLRIRSSKSLHVFKSMIFTDEKIVAELKKSSFIQNFNFDDYVVVGEDLEVFPGNWKHYAVVYNDNSHIRMMHPEMSNVLDVGTTEWELGEGYNSHRLRYKENWRNHDNVFVNMFKSLEKKGVNLKNDGLLDYGVTFVNVYPNVFIDFWAGVVSIDVVEPITTDSYFLHTTILIRKDLADDEEFIENCSKAIMHVSDQDRNILRRIKEGRDAISSRGSVYEEYVLESFEIGDSHLFDWFAKNGKDFYSGPMKREKL